jgi:hypothetical protein
MDDAQDLAVTRFRLAIDDRRAMCPHARAYVSRRRSGPSCPGRNMWQDKLTALNVIVEVFKTHAI